MPNIVQGLIINSAEGADKITSTDKITAGYFTGGDGTISGITIHTGSLADSNEKYYKIWHSRLSKSICLF